MKRFEDIEAWQEARKLAAAVYHETQRPRFSRDFNLRNQICGAARSITANIAEGFERNNLSEFRNFLRYAKASCAEVKSDCYLALDIGYIDEDRLQRFLAHADTVSGKIRRLDESIERLLGTRHSALGTKDNVPRKPENRSPRD